LNTKFKQRKMPKHHWQSLQRQGTSPPRTWSLAVWAHILRQIESFGPVEDSCQTVWMETLRDLSDSCLAVIAYQSSLVETPAFECVWMLAHAELKDQLLLSSACKCFSEVCTSFVTEMIYNLMDPAHTSIPVGCSTQSTPSSDDSDLAVQIFLRGWALNCLLPRGRYRQLRRICEQLNMTRSLSLWPMTDETRLVFGNSANSREVVGWIKTCENLLRKSVLGEEWVTIQRHDGARFHASFQGELRKDLPLVYTTTWEMTSTPTWFEDDPWIKKTLPYLFPAHYHECLEPLANAARPESASSSISDGDLQTRPQTVSM